MKKLFNTDKLKLTNVTPASRDVPPDITSANSSEALQTPHLHFQGLQPLHALSPQFSPPPPNLDVSRPIRDDDAVMHVSSESSTRGEKKERGGFWSWAITGDRDSDRREAHDKDDYDLARMIGYLTAASCEDWAVVLYVCERVSATEANAKEAAKALRREFRYGDAPQQLSAAKLWAIMVQNSSELFVHQCGKNKFLDTLEDVLTAQRTSPVVRERLLDVLAAAAYASSGTPHKNEAGFCSLWRKVKPPGKPDEGVPFDVNDPMFNPPSPPQPPSQPQPQPQPQPLRPQTQIAQQPNRAEREALHQLSSLLDTHATHGASSFQKATPEGRGRPSQQITHEQNPRPMGASGSPRHVPEEDDDDESSTKHHAKLMAPEAPSRKEIARLEDGRLIELERQLSEALVAKTERDQRIAQLADGLALKSALLESAGAKLVLKNTQLQQAEASAAEEKKRARLELRELQAKLDESLLSRNRAIEQIEANAAEEMRRAGLELRELQAKLDESLLSRNHALEQAQCALQRASCAAEANEQSQRELTEMRVELEARKSESAASRLRLGDTENGCAKSKADANTNRNQTATGLVIADEDRVVHRLMERVQAMEVEIASLRWNEKALK